VPWHSAFLRIRDYQWNDVAVPFRKNMQAFAAGHDVKVCLEMHPGNVVFNPRTLDRLATEIGATHVGAELDPSHLFWQGIDRRAGLAPRGAYSPGFARLPRRLAWTRSSWPSQSGLQLSVTARAGGRPGRS
jgi:hypothetical protein